LNRIDRIGLVFGEDLPTKGQASDIIGLFEPPDYGDRELLKFFKVPLREMTQTRAKYLVEQLLSDPDNASAWDNRPASTEQKGFYRYFNLKVPKGLTHEEDAQLFIREYRRKLTDEDWGDYVAYGSMHEEINDPDNREDYGIKRVNLSLYRAALDELKNEGKRPSEFEDDLSPFVEKIIQMQPDIKNG
ncbi:MAG: hypothetical protein WBM52_19995, partial [Thiogranum sp.]